MKPVLGIIGGSGLYNLDGLKNTKLDKGNKNFQPSNLEFTNINVNNKRITYIYLTEFFNLNMLIYYIKYLKAQQ